MKSNTYKRFSICIRLFLKRLLNRFSFVLILCLLPILTLGLKYMLNTSDISVRVGLFSEDNGHYAAQIIDKLTTNNEGIVFVEFKSTKEMFNSISTRSYECGYIFPKDFSKNLSDANFEKIIDLYISPGTAIKAISNEYVYSEFFSIHAFYDLIDYIDSRDYFSFSNDKLVDLDSKLKPIYNDYLNGKDTFSFEYITPASATKSTSISLPSYILSSATGIAALFIMLGAFAGTINLYKDSKNGVFNAFPSKTRILYKTADIFSGTILTTISSLLTILISNNFLGFTATILPLILYSIICTIYCYLLYILLPSLRLFLAIIPILIMGSIIFCPLIIDFSVILPIAKTLKWIFPPAYFFI